MTASQEGNRNARTYQELSEMSIWRHARLRPGGDCLPTARDPSTTASGQFPSRLRLQPSFPFYKKPFRIVRGGCAVYVLAPIRMPKAFALVAVVVVGLPACQTVDSRIGSGPITLSPHVQAGFERYRAHNQPHDFAVSTDGRSYHYTFCQEVDCLYDWNQAIERCERSARKRGHRCKLYAIDGKVVWRGAEVAALPDNEGTFNVHWFTGSGGRLYPGKIVFTGHRSGSLKARLGAKEYCDGEFSLAGSNLTWSLTCPDGNAINGTVENYSPEHGGYGDGRDQNGQIVEMRIASGIKLNAPRPRPAADSPAATPATSARHETRSLAIVWEGGERPIAGTIRLEQKGAQGAISFDLPGNAGTCSGTYQLGANQQGTWAVACSDGQTVSGKYEAFGDGRGSSGVGADNKGRKVTFTVGPRGGSQ